MPAGEWDEAAPPYCSVHDEYMTVPFYRLLGTESRTDGTQVVPPGSKQVSGQARPTVYEAVAVLFAARHTLPSDVLRSLQDIWICASAARFGEPYEGWEVDAQAYRDHNVVACESGSE